MLDWRRKLDDWRKKLDWRRKPFSLLDLWKEQKEKIGLSDMTSEEIIRMKMKILLDENVG